MTKFQPRFRPNYDRIPAAGELLVTGEGELYASPPDGSVPIPLQSVITVNSVNALNDISSALRNLKKIYRVGDNLYRWTGTTTGQISDWVLLNPAASNMLPYSVPSAVGNADRVLGLNGDESGLEWKDLPAAASDIGAAAASHTHTATDVTGGTSGQLLQSNGTNGVWTTVSIPQGTVKSVSGTAPITASTSDDAVTVGIQSYRTVPASAASSLGRILYSGNGTTANPVWLTAGSSGQVLQCNGSNSAPTWVTPNAGTLTGITAGNGISVSGSAPTLTVAHSNDAITSATRGPTAAVSGLGGSISVPSFTFDTQGHFIASNAFTITSPTAAQVAAAEFTNSTVNSTEPVTTTASRAISAHISLAFSNIRWLNANKGTSSLAIGTTGTTAAAGDTQITAATLTASTLTLTRAAENLTASIPAWNQNTTGNASTADALNFASTSIVNRQFYARKSSNQGTTTAGGVGFRALEWADIPSFAPTAVTSTTVDSSAQSRNLQEHLTQLYGNITNLSSNYQKRYASNTTASTQLAVLPQTAGNALEAKAISDFVLAPAAVTAAAAQQIWSSPVTKGAAPILLPRNTFVRHWDSAITDTSSWRTWIASLVGTGTAATAQRSLSGVVTAVPTSGPTGFAATTSAPGYFHYNSLNANTTQSYANILVISNDRRMWIGTTANITSTEFTWTEIAYGGHTHHTAGDIINLTTNGDYIMRLSGTNGATKAWTTVTIPTAGTASGNVPTLGGAASTTAGVPAVFNSSGELIAHASGALGVGAFAASQDAKKFLAAPNAAAGAPLFRTFVLEDLPNISASTILGNNTANAAAPSELSTTNVKQLLFGTAGIGSSTLPIYIDTSGNPTNITQANLRIGLFGTSAIGGTARPIYLAANGVPTAISSTVRSVYVNQATTANSPEWLQGSNTISQVLRNTAGTLAWTTNTPTAQVLVGGTTAAAEIDWTSDTQAQAGVLIRASNTTKPNWTNSAPTGQVLVGGTTVTTAPDWTSNTGTQAGGASGSATASAVLVRAAVATKPIWAYGPASGSFGQVLISGTSATATPMFTTGGSAGQVLTRNSSNNSVEWTAHPTGYPIRVFVAPASNVTNISSVSGAKIGDILIKDASTTSRTILGIATSISGYPILITSATTGVALPYEQASSTPAACLRVTGIPGFAGRLYIRTTNTDWSSQANQTTHYAGNQVGDYVTSNAACSYAVFGIAAGSFPSGTLARIVISSATAAGIAEIVPFIGATTNSAGTGISISDGAVSINYATAATWTGAHIFSSTVALNNAVTTGVSGTINNTHIRSLASYRLSANRNNDDVTTDYNTWFGARTVSANTGQYNVGLGDRVGNALTSGTGNTLVGSAAGTALNTSNYNTAVGYRALSNCSSGSYNSALGSYTGYSLTTSAYNTFLGHNAGYSLTTSAYNTFLGYNAGYSASTGDGNNVAVGNSALYNQTTAQYNTAVGVNAGRYISTGTTTRSTGNFNLYLGHTARASNNGINNEIVIGAGAIGKGSNTVVLGVSAANDIVLGSGATTPTAATATTYLYGSLIFNDGVAATTTNRFLIGSDSSAGRLSWTNAATFRTAIGASNVMPYTVPSVSGNGGRVLGLDNTASGLEWKDLPTGGSVSTVDVVAAGKGVDHLNPYNFVLVLKGDTRSTVYVISGTAATMQLITNKSEITGTYSSSPNVTKYIFTGTTSEDMKLWITNRSINLSDVSLTALSNGLYKVINTDGSGGGSSS